MAKKTDKRIWYIVGAVVFLLFISQGGDKDKKAGGFGCSHMTTDNMIDNDNVPSEEKTSAVNIYLTDQACIQQYAPVCKDGVTYPNSCYARQAGKTNFMEGECVQNQERARVVTAVRTSIVKVELIDEESNTYIVYDGEIPIELDRDNIQLIVSEQIKSGNYTHVRLTWGGNVEIKFNDETFKTIDFPERVHTIHIGFVHAMRQRTTNIMLDVPINESLVSENNMIRFRPQFAVEHNNEEQLRLYQQDIGKVMTREQTRERVQELKDRFMAQHGQ